NIKTAAVASVVPYAFPIVAGSSDFVDFMGNKRTSYFCIRGQYYAGANYNMDIRLTLEYGPAYAGILTDLLCMVNLIQNNVLGQTGAYICGVRFGRQTVLNLGLSFTRRLTRRVHASGLPCVIDDKLSDIGPTNEAIARAYYRLGFDAIIVNPSSGWKGGLEPV